MSYRRRVKLIMFVSLIFVFAMFVSVTNVCAQASEPFKLTIGGSSIGTSFYAIMSAYARIWNEKVPEIHASVEGTGGGIDNLSLVQDGQIEFGGGVCAAVYMAVRGIEDFEGKEPFDNIRGFGMMYEWPLQVVVMEGSPIKTMNDLKGKRVVVGAQGAGSETTTRQVLGSLGMSFDDIEPFWLGYAETMDGLKLGNLDAVVISGGAPTPALLELEATHRFKVIALSDEEMKKINSDYPYYVPGIMKAGTYATIKEDIPTIFGFPVLFTHKDVPDDIIYKALKAIWDNFYIMESTHPSQIGLTPERAYENIKQLLPLHPGAERYYREIGVIE